LVVSLLKVIGIWENAESELASFSAAQSAIQSLLLV
jgi:hypothetical protein